MGNLVPRAALWAVAVLMLASVLASVGTAQAGATPNYTLVGYVEQPSGVAVGVGVTVVLTSAATHQTYSTQTSSRGGQFIFSSSGNAPGLTPGWWGLQVPPQAHVSLAGGDYAVLPTNQSAQYSFLSATALGSPGTPSTIYDVALALYNATINGTVTFGGKAQSGASVELLDPLYDGFILSNNTTSTNRTHLGYYSISVPWGNWVLETIVPGQPDYYNYTMAVVDASTLTKTNVTINPALSTTKSYLTWGYVNTGPTTHVPNGGNVTVIDPLTHYIYSQPTPQGGYYSVGTYGSQTFDVVLSTVGYTTVWYPLTVSPTNPSGAPPSPPHNVYVSAMSPPAKYSTVLNYSAGFGKLNVSTVATLGNDSVFPDLANASVGQLWAQLALDWQHNVTFAAANLSAFFAWANSSGPFFPAGQADAMVNGTGYGQPTNDTFQATSNCTSFCGLSSPATATLRWSQSYNLTAKLTSTKAFQVSFEFRHPTNAQSFNYSVVLPSGYVLEAGTPVPAQASLVPAGPGGTWTSFTLVSKPSSSASYGDFSFNVVKYGSVTAAVNVSAQEFSWSAKNVLNSTHNNYTVVAGAGENLTFSALNSTFTSRTNGTNYTWSFGDGSNTSTPNGTTNHTYQHPGAYVGSLTVVSSGNQRSTVAFKVFVGNQRPTAVISVNDTNVKTANSVPYLIVNWSTALQFNASTSTSVINAPGNPPSGFISDSFWNITNGPSQTWNFSASAGANPIANLTTSFLGQGKYLTQGSANGAPIPGSFFGWQFNVTLTVWDYGGLNDTTTMVVLVRDTEKPVPSITLKQANGKVVPSSGLVEALNHTAEVIFSSVNSSDLHNGSIAWYNWSITNANTTANFTVDLPATGSNFGMPGQFPRWLDPQGKPYTVNLTVTDRAGNRAWTTVSLSISVNTSDRPVLAVSNLTAPDTMTDGSSYTIWVNVTNTVGVNSTARNVSVRFYLLAPSGTGSQTNIGGSPASVKFYNVTNGTVSSSPIVGPVSIPWNKTVRAEIQFNPSRTGTWDLWVNATASNEFPADYQSGANQAHVEVTLNQSPTVLYEEVGAIVAAVAVVIVLLVFYFRRRVSKGGKGPSSGKLERSSKKDEDDE